MNEQEVGFRGLEPDAEEERGAGLAIVDQAMGLVERAQLDSQVATAKAYPRSIKKSLQTAQGLATLDAKTAAGMFYTLKRGKGRDEKVIMGPSTRLAEVVAHSWGNLRVEAGVESEDAKFITAVAVCFDLETNVAVRIRTRRRITTSGGQRYGDDMVGVTGNAATSIAFRNAVFRVVPRVFVDRLDLLAREASTGKGTLEEKRARAAEHFTKLGVTEAELFAFCGSNVKGWDDVTLEHVVQLQGAATSLREGMATVDELFRPQNESEDARDLTAGLKGNGGARPAAAPPPPTEPGPETPMTPGELAQVESALASASELGILELERSLAFEKMENEGRWADLRKATRELQLELVRVQELRK